MDGKRIVLSTPASRGYVVAESREDLIETLLAIVELVREPEHGEFRIDLAPLPAYDPEWTCLCADALHWIRRTPEEVPAEV